MLIEIEEDVLKGLQCIVDATGATLEETVNILLTACEARKGAWGLLDRPEPGLEFLKRPDGSRIKGEELYREVFKQMWGWINGLLLGERLLIELIGICHKNSLLNVLKDDSLKGAADRYVERKYKN